jgi:hypothetical protein
VAMGVLKYILGPVWVGGSPFMALLLEEWTRGQQRNDGV